MSLIEDSHIGYVNLDHRSDRNVLMKQNLALHNIPAKRYSGVLPHERLEEKSHMNAMNARPQKGALGCFLAQMDVMRDALAQNKHAWVMEDDLVFCSDFNKRLDYIGAWTRGGITRAFRDWDVIWLGGTFHVGGRGPYWHTQTLGRDADITDDPRMLRTYGSFCTYAYIINHNSVGPIMNLLKGTWPTSIGIDHSFITLSPLLKTFAFVPGCIKQYDNVSDQIPGTPVITHFSKFEKLGPYWWQDKMEDFDPTAFDWAEADPKNREV
jgi:GR25 family glycosyltransferase involved in LPS biosynthesis